MGSKFSKKKSNNKTQLDNDTFAPPAEWGTRGLQVVMNNDWDADSSQSDSGITHLLSLTLSYIHSLAIC